MPSRQENAVVDSLSRRHQMEVPTRWWQTKASQQMLSHYDLVNLVLTNSRKISGRGGALDFMTEDWLHDVSIVILHTASTYVDCVAFAQS